MNSGLSKSCTISGVPSWVPHAAIHYLAHTETGTSIRALARKAGCHASTVSRQIRKFESRRDDLLVDEALRRLGRHVSNKRTSGSHTKEEWMDTCVCEEAGPDAVSENRLKTEALRILRRMGETGAVLAVAAKMEKAIVVRESDDGTSSRTAVVDRDIAEAMALKNWIKCETPGRVARYRITPTGRTKLGFLIAESENRATGFAEAQAGFVGQAENSDIPEGETPKRIRYGVTETPLILLARRRDRDGSKFLSEDLVRAGERLREDFELAGFSTCSTQNWDGFLKISKFQDNTESYHVAGREARRRVIKALRDLGPGLGDVVLCCCCYLEGLERAEKRMGWSARSGKIVLRIALQRLRRHYDELGEAGGLMG